VGDGAKTEGWIWRQGYYGNLTDEEEAKYVQDFHCYIAAKVQWHRAWADMERWQEELEIVGQEFRRAVQGFNKMHSVWTALADDHKNNPGRKAYASKVASMYEQMEKNMCQQFEKVGGTWPKVGVSLAQHIKSERPDPSIDW
ncbi:hypothetical protein DFH09DRAFT_867734, partial [Mycena vulgaris]